jgi:hypothetical protein
VMWWTRLVKNGSNNYSLRKEGNNREIGGRWKNSTTLQ